VFFGRGADGGGASTGTAGGDGNAGTGTDAGGGVSADADADAGGGANVDASGGANADVGGGAGTAAAACGYSGTGASDGVGCSGLIAPLRSANLMSLTSCMTRSFERLSSHVL